MQINVKSVYFMPFDGSKSGLEPAVRGEDESEMLFNLHFDEMKWIISIYVHMCLTCVC